MKNSKSNIVNKYIPVTALVCILVACGGGSGSSDQFTETADSSVNSPAVNRPPLANAGLDRNAAGGETVIVYGGASSDLDGTITDSVWVQISGEPVELIDDTFVAPRASGAPLRLEFRLTVTDNDGANGSDTAVINVLPDGTADVPLAADAGPDRAAVSGDLVVLNGEASTGSDDSIVEYAWIQTDGPPVSLIIQSSGAQFTAPNVHAATSVVLTLTVTDQLGASDVDAVTITVTPAETPVESPPTAVIAPISSQFSGAAVILNGRDSHDQDGEISSFLWQQTEGRTVELQGANTHTATFTAPLVESATSILRFSLNVIDNSQISDIATVTVEVVPRVSENQPPAANAISSADVYTSGFTVALSAAGSTDTDGTINTYQWLQTQGPPIDVQPGNAVELQFSAPDVSQSTDFTFLLTVTDEDGDIGTDTVGFTVNPAAPLNPESGLETLPENLSCLAGPAPSTEVDITTERVFDELVFSRPLQLLMAPGDDTRWYVVEQAGRVLTFNNTGNTTTADVLLDIRATVDMSSNLANPESGLLGMAFHPDFQSNNHLYLYYQVSENAAPANGNGVPDLSPVADECCQNRLARYTYNPATGTIDPDSARVLIQFTHPNFQNLENHFGGALLFGPDDYLYLGIGDGGGSGAVSESVHQLSQQTNNLLGSVLRLDVNVPDAPYYSIPADNPFASQSALCNSNAALASRTEDCPEIGAWGLRNPWRGAFDSNTAGGETAFWLADVGQNRSEEINLIETGRNYGWPTREGDRCYSGEDCDSSGLTDPVAEISHTEANNFQSITGGVVYRGTAIPSLQGRFIAGDFMQGRISAIDPANQYQVENLISESGHFNIADFAEDAAGELYFLDYFSGTIRRIVPADDSQVGVPALLSNTGCVDLADPSQPYSGMIPYDINAPFWSDGAAKRRWFALPPGQQIAVDDNGDWHFPEGSVLMKSFELGGDLIEIRLLKHHIGGTWRGYSYRWNPLINDGQWVQGGDTVEIQDQDWVYPSGGQCTECHTQAAGVVLGLESAQMNRNFSYPSTGLNANQLTTLFTIGALPAEPDDAPLANPADNSGHFSLNQRARAYLHTNCSQCHRPNGPTSVNIDFRFSAAFEDMNLCQVAQNSAGLGDGARRLVPGDAENSVMLQRMRLRDSSSDSNNQMPPLSSLVDEFGAELVAAAINSLDPTFCGELEAPQERIFSTSFESAEESLSGLTLYDGDNPNGTPFTAESSEGVTATQTDGRYRAEITSNAGNQTQFYNNNQGRLDGVAVTFPFEVIARNVGIGQTGNSQAAPPFNNAYMLSGLQVHNANFTSVNYAAITVGHTNRNPFIVEGKNTRNGVSVFDVENNSAVPAGRADLRIVGHADGTLTGYWQIPRNTGEADNWVLYQGNMNAPAGAFPGVEPEFGDEVIVGLVTYAAGTNIGDGFVGTCDSLEIRWHVAGGDNAD